jgi:hypothetical protein
MKTKTALFAKITLAFAAILLLSAVPRAAAVPVTFSGGSGTPLSFSLAAPVSYTITTAPSGGPFFLFQNAGNPFSALPIPITSSITFSINGGSAQILNKANSGASGGVITANDLFFFGFVIPFNVGDVVTLTAGTWTTTSNVAAAAPANGDFRTFIFDNGLFPVSTNGVSGVPESFSTLWLALPLVGMVAMRRRLLLFPHDQIPL